MLGGKSGREEEGKADGMGQLLQELQELREQSCRVHRAREGHLSTSGSIVDDYGNSGLQSERCPVRKLSQGCRPGTSVGPSPHMVTAEA